MLNEAHETDTTRAGLRGEIRPGRRTAVDQPGDHPGIALTVRRVDLLEKNVEELLGEAVLDSPDGIDVLQVPITTDDAQVATRDAIPREPVDLRFRLAKAADRRHPIQEIITLTLAVVVKGAHPGLDLSVQDRADFLGDLRELLVSLIPLEAEERPPVLRASLNPPEPFHLIPGAGLDDHRDDRQLFGNPPFQETGDLFAQDEWRSQEMLRNEEDGHTGVRHGLLDFREPARPRSDATVVPGVDLQYAQVRREEILPPLVLVAVAQEDRGHAGSLREQRRGSSILRES